MRHQLLGGVALCGFALATGGAALAQDRDEIIVSARKTEETLQEAPISVTAITEQAIRERNIVSIDDLSRFAPGLSFSQAFGRSGDRPVIRGQSNVLANVQFGVESGTAYFIDGIYYPTTIQSIDFDLIKRVEVIRGPQSALYGRNTYAGAINLITIDPAQEFTAGIRGRWAQGDEYSISGNVGGPIIQDVLGAVVSARYYEYGGQYVNEITGDNVGQEESWSIAGILNFTPAERFKAKARISYQQDNDGSIPLFLQGSAENNCWPGFRSNNYRAGGTLNATPGGTNANQYYCGVIEPGPVQLNTQASNNPAFPGSQFDGTAFDGIERDLLVTGLVMDWELTDTVTLTSQTGYRDETERFGSDSDHSDAQVYFGPPGVGEPAFANTNVEEIKDWSQEIRIQWAPSDRFRFLVGGFYYDQEIDNRDITFTSGEQGGPITDTSTVENWAIFGLAEVGITDQISLTGELRYMEETKSLVNFSAAGAVTFSGENTEDYLTPRITLSYQPSSNFNAYFIFAEGVKPGGFNGALGASINAETYRPETANSFELGAKTTWLDGAVTMNASLYYLDATDVQLTTAVPPVGGGGGAVTSVATNQGQGETWGLEAEFFAELTDNLSLALNYAWTRPEFTVGCDADQFIFESGGRDFNGIPSPDCSIAGNRYPLISEHMGSFVATYTHPVGNKLEAFYSLNGSYESSKFVQVHNQAETGDAFVLGGQIGVRSGNWQANLFVRNLTNEDSIVLATRWFDLRYGFGPNVGRILADGGALGGPNAVSTGLPRAFFGTLRRPRQFGVELNYNF
ncbi:MAG: TonB-dependent receptor plug domain-containing protein [Alphaproteobacteria bacterium]|nr:TonB-dependent receptor plug domain-containing protein [Alphaproteobacteria bacterium]